MVLVSYIPIIMLVFYKLNSAIERGTKPDALGWKPCHWTNTLKAAMVNASRAWKYAQHAVHDFLEMADHGQHREHRLHQHAVLPLAALTQFEVGWIALCGMEGGITQDNHAFLELPNEPLKGVIRDIGGGTRPPHHQAVLVQEQTEFAADNPAMVREAFAADLLGAAAFADGMDQLDPIGVDDPEHGRSSQEGLRPVLMGLEEAKEPGPLGQVGEQGPIVACQPAIERRGCLRL